jgi:hypothetical protein
MDDETSVSRDAAMTRLKVLVLDHLGIPQPGVGKHLQQLRGQLLPAFMKTTRYGWLAASPMVTLTPNDPIYQYLGALPNRAPEIDTLERILGLDHFAGEEDHLVAHADLTHRSRRIWTSSCRHRAACTCGGFPGGGRHDKGTARGGDHARCSGQVLANRCRDVGPRRIHRHHAIVLATTRGLSFRSSSIANCASYRIGLPDG